MSRVTGTNGQEAAASGTYENTEKLQLSIHSKTALPEFDLVHVVIYQIPLRFLSTFRSPYDAHSTISEANNPRLTVGIRFRRAPLSLLDIA